MLVYFNQFKFLIGDYKSVVNIVLSLFANQDSKIILPCSLNDLALSESKSYYKLVDFCVTDSMFLTWWFRSKYHSSEIARVYGPDLLISLLCFLNEQKLGTSFLIADKVTYKIFKNKIKKLYPDLNGQFNVLLDQSSVQEEATLDKIIASKPKIIFLGVGSPKQIELATYLKKRLKNCTIFCVGAAFDFFSGQKKQAPMWIRKSGLEWFFRLIMEPKRLYKRYLVTIPRYLVLLLINRVSRKINL